MDNYIDIEQIVLSFLFHEPNLIFDDRYPIKWSDFTDKTHQYIYSAMATIFSQSGTVNVSEIELQLGKSAGARRFYDEHNGHSRLCAIENLFLKDFSYESKYQDLKKYSLLKALNREGIDTREIYDPTLEPDKAIELINKFEQMTYQEIIELYRKKLATIEDKYENLIEKSGIAAGDGIDELLHSFEEQPEVGVPLIGDLLNTATRGARRKKVYLNSASSGTGKTRMAAGNVAKIGFPMYYDEEHEKWVDTGMCYPVLFITTELEHSEVQTMFLSYISGVNEEKILNNRYDTKDEKNRVLKAADIIQKCTNVYIEFIPNPSIESVASKIRLYALQKDIEFVFYDYIHVSGATYSSKKDMRDDVWLMLFVDKLKQLANELDLHISTATQVNASNYEDREIKNEALIRGAKSIADKTDFAMITSPVLKEQEKALAKSLAAKMGTREPNQILDIYKNRRGKWRSIRIWRYTDLGTCRSIDCFATDTGNNPIDMSATKIKVKQLVKEGSFPIVNEETGEIVAENRRMSEISDY